jgi:hypothetical protein
MFMLNELEKDLGTAEDLDINIPTQILLNEIGAKVKDTKKANIKKPVKKNKREAHSKTKREARETTKGEARS